uniref:Uncharacterized protein n=1 Tax=Anguilla anguilla TaxID=7936 RepID=A0A0E9TMH3_ANGAN
MINHVCTVTVFIFSYNVITLVKEHIWALDLTTGLGPY